MTVGNTADADPARDGRPSGVTPEAARAAQRSGRWHEALEAWRHIARTTPHDLAISLHIAHCLEQLDRLDEAEALYRRVAEALPDDVRAQRSLARISQRRGDWAAAARYWQAIMAIRPDTSEPALHAARCLERLQRSDEAEAAYRHLTKAFPQEVDAHRRLARINQRRGDWEAALAHWQAVRTVDGADTDAAMHAAQCLERLQRLDEAEAEYRRLTETAPGDVRVHRSLARLSQGHGDWETALAHWQAVAASAPEDAQPALQVARCLERLERLDEAETAYGWIVKTFPDELRAHRNLAQISLRRGDWQRALGHWQAVAAIMPDAPDPVLRQAQCLSRLRRLHEAEATYRRIIGRWPLEVRGHRGLARVCQLRGDWQTALTRWQGVTATFPDDSEAALGLAHTLLRLERFDEAETAYQRIAKDWPREAPRAQRGLALASQLRGNWNKALGRWRAATADTVPDLPALLGVGESLEAIGRLSEAVRVYEEAVERFPRDPRSIFALTAAVLKGQRSETPAGAKQRIHRHLAAMNRADEPRLRNVGTFLRQLIDAALLRPVVDDRDAEVRVERAETGRTVLLVFTGMQGGWPFPIALFDAFMAARGISVVYLRDFSRSIFCGGVPSLSNSYDGTLSALRDLRRQLGGRRLYTLGTSAGGFAAIRYGLDLDADGILGFGAPTKMTTAFMSDNDDVRGQLVWRRLNRTFPPEALDLKPHFARKHEVPRTDLYFGADMREDAVHANYLADVPGVHLHPIADCKAHACMLHLIEAGRLAEILDTWIGRDETAHV